MKKRIHNPPTPLCYTHIHKHIHCCYFVTLKMGKSKKSLNEAVNKARNSERELQVAKKELSSAQREREQLRSNSKNLDLKLNRAFAEIDKLKGKVKTQRSHGKATGMIMMVMKIVGVLLIINNAIKIRVGLTYYLLIMQVTPLGKSSSRQIQNFENFKRLIENCFYHYTHHRLVSHLVPQTPYSIQG